MEVGVPNKDKKKIQDHLTAIRILKERGVKGSGIIGAYHMRRVAPLMKRTLPLHMIAPRVSLEGTTLTAGGDSCWHQLSTGCRLCKRVDRLVEAPRDVIEFEAIILVLQPEDLSVVCSHLGVMAA